MTRRHGPVLAGSPGWSRGLAPVTSAARRARPSRRARAARPQRGAVTAELALGLPLLLSVTVGLVWLLAAGAAQVRAVDAARETARALARGDDQAAAVALGQRVATSGAAIRVDVVDGEARVVATAPVAGPGGLFSALPTVQVEATAVAVVEGDGGGW